MCDEDDIVETIKEEVAEAAKAVVADVKAIVHEVADAIAESVGNEHPQHIRPLDHDSSKANLPAEAGGDDASRRGGAADR